MESPLEIRYHGLSSSAALNLEIEEYVADLERICRNVVSARVTIEMTTHRHRKGNPFRVTIDVHVPGAQLVVSRAPIEGRELSDPYVALRYAFDAMQGEVHEYVEKRRREVKHHEDPLGVGRVARLFPFEGYGFIASNDGREVFFDESAVTGGKFERLDVGSTVRFFEVRGEKGPQASTVHA